MAVVTAALLAISLTAAGGAIELGVKDRANATPSIAAEQDLVAVAWGASAAGGATDVYAAMSRDGGRAFAPPVRVNNLDGDARMNGEQPPRVSVRGRVVTVVWTTKGPAGTRLVHSRSTDGGRTFSPAAAVPGGDAPGNRGWQNTVADRNGRVYTVWLDHRELATQDSAVATGHHHSRPEQGRGTNKVAPQNSALKPDGVAMAARSKLYVASLDGAIAPRAVTGGVCYCCKTAVAAGADGALYTAWRHVYPGNLRDIAFSVSRDGGRSFAAPLRVSEDKWALEGCPDDGPAMAVDAHNRIHIVWPTLVTDAPADRDHEPEPTIALFYAMSVDGRGFMPRQRISTEGMPHHPQITIAPDGALTMAWDEGANGTRRAVAARAAMDAAGRPRFARVVLAERAVYPVVAATSDATVVAWTSAAAGGSVIRVERR